MHQMDQAAARDPTCIPALLHTALGARRQLASVTDPEAYRDLQQKLRYGLSMLGIIIAHPESWQPLGAALAAAPPATLDALAEWITQPGPSGAEVELVTVDLAFMVAAWAANCSPAAAAALARRRSVVRALVSALGRLISPDNRHVGVGPSLVAERAFAMFYAMLRASYEDVMRALAAGQPGSGRDGDDLVQRLRGLVEAVVAGGGLEAAMMESAEAVLAALAEGEDWLKTHVNRQQQQQQQPRGSRACAGCGKTAADEG